MADFEGAKKHILRHLEENLPEHLSYHSVDHTLDVYAVAMDLSEHYGLDPADRQILATAALLHDVGFVLTYEGHEKKSVAYAREVLPKFNYSSEQIDRIADLILSTQVPQSPKSQLARILCDADPDYLGRKDFFVTGSRLFHEFKTLGFVGNEQDWNKLQQRFLESHDYHTDYSKERREPVKQMHLEQVREIVAAYDD
ncbi:MAG: HD domain-containing protein [Flavobacteriales bacterium]|nr:HD domain-containing protein [Flavobacteriales bacterium]